MVFRFLLISLKPDLHRFQRQEQALWSRNFFSWSPWNKSLTAQSLEGSWRLSTRRYPLLGEIIRNTGFVLCNSKTLQFIAGGKDRSNSLVHISLSVRSRLYMAKPNTRSHNSVGNEVTFSMSRKLTKKKTPFFIFPTQHPESRKHANSHFVQRSMKLCKPLRCLNIVCRNFSQEQNATTHLYGRSFLFCPLVLNLERKR